MVEWCSSWCSSWCSWCSWCSGSVLRFRSVARWLWPGWLLAEFAVHSGVGILGLERLHSLLSGRKLEGLEGRTTEDLRH